jgi:ABC-type multidrug transport system fused ATPase/permease subunit
VQAFSDDVGPLTTAKYSLGFLDIILGFPAGSQLTFEEAVQAGVTYQTTNQVFSDYIMHLLELSSLIYLDYGRSFMMQYDNIRLTMIVIFSFIFVFFYIFAFQRLVSELSRTAAQTNAIMLLLPLQMSTHNKHAQEYIARNLSRD